MITNGLVGGLAILCMGLMLSGCEPPRDEPETPEAGAGPEAGAEANAGGSSQTVNTAQRAANLPTEPTYSYRSDGTLDYDSARIWTDHQGRSLEAQLQEFDQQTVQLRDRVGQVKSIQRESLSPADDRWLDDVKAALPAFEVAEDAPDEFTVIDTVDGQFYTKVTVEEYGNLGVTIVTRTGGQVHLPYNILNKSHLRKIGYPLNDLENEPIAANR